MIATKHVNAAVTGDDTGTFDVILSEGSLDRHGEVVSPKSWKLPLPERIHFNVEHGSSVSDIVGSGTPWLDELGRLRVKGVFASTPEAQHIRTLVAEGHAQFVSVEFLRNKSADGEPVNELIGGAFTAVPANPNARILSAKAFDTALKSVLAGEPLLQAIHDASVHLGAACIVGYDDDADGDMDPTGAEDGANKSAALRLRLKALSR